ncbi:MULTISPECIES: TonB-dependent receptor plug domain-containing protein [Acinetobacter calcoaceticus/baumannii complex]|uniref:TonB-dependent receptor n=1 Tax=Acinetobacter nosocomialis 28F TaxID=1147131 RepID=A0AA36KB79_ACINO|nr:MULTISPECIES: TonB-dependent receptor [Acinetobacter calcoaceticus/baumannii complex]KCX94447.1 tonB dependent receptor family protein [Acinetobacter baumannii 6112]EYT15223.1 tonB dependent receptor family protein [Acinetobacter sp. 1592897]OTK99100.1 ligand-gated channel protein [Acinetobacter nosocomialis]OUR05413.1 ligand-gated channel protein [Acinetobacter nosocomialis]CDG74247.1 TonB-dependent receptor [Acinetobacter nosocomialis 28F]
MEHVMSKSFQPTRLVGAIAIAMGCSPIIFAEDTTNATQLDPIVVTASKSAEKASEVPARISVIDEKTIEQNPLLNVSDIIQRDPSIYVKQSGGLGQISEISLRGTKSVHTLVLKDGARLNSQNELGPLYPAFLDTTDVQQIEILKGPASVQYGSDAIGGVVQLISKKPEKTGAELTGIYGENNTYKTIVNANLVSDQGFYAQLGGQRLESDGTRIFESQPENEKAGYDQKGYHAKVGFYQENLIDASASISENKGTNIFSNDYITNTAQRLFENRVINTKVAYNILPDLIINAHYANVQDKQNVPAYDSYYNTENNESDLNLKWKFTPHQNILVGATYNDANYKSNTILNSDKSVNSTGYYLQHQLKNDLFDTQVGVRLEDNQRFGTHTVGQGAIRYHFLPNASVYANIGSAFRAPTLNELYSQWGGNENLTPEKSTSYEMGVNYDLTSNVSTNFSVYHTKIKDLIAYNAGTNTNIAKANFTGGEAGVKWHQDDLFLSTEYAYVKTENEKDNTEIAYRPRQTLTVSTGLENAVYGISASLIARAKSYADSANSMRVPGYATVDLNAYWNVIPNVKLFTNIQNVGDVQYREVLNTYPSNDWYVNTGRQASVGVTFRY